jgi:hypothetical protein
MPKDPTPLGDEMARRMPQPKFPQPMPGRENENPAANEEIPAPDAEHRPGLPEHPTLMAVDEEDESADPVIDSGPGIDEPPHSLRKQKG